MRCKNVIFSPHCDDAALSLGGAIYNKILKKVFVHDIFSVSNYTILEPGTGNPKVVSRIRHKEEKIALKKLGSQYKLWGYSEPLLRNGYKNISDIFAKRIRSNELRIYDEILNKTRNICLSNVNAKYFFPLGIGGHIDHIIVAEVGLNILKKNPDLNIFFYEDQPYSGAHKINAIEKYSKKKNKCFSRFTFAFDNVLDKMFILKIYKSQLDAEDTAYTFWHTLRRGGECVWSFKEKRVLLEES